MHYHVISASYSDHKLPQILTPYRITAFLEFQGMVCAIVNDLHLRIREFYEDVVIFENGSWACWYPCENEFCKDMAGKDTNTVYLSRYTNEIGRVIA